MLFDSVNPWHGPLRLQPLLSDSREAAYKIGMGKLGAGNAGGSGRRLKGATAA